MPPFKHVMLSPILYHVAATCTVICTCKNQQTCVEILCFLLSGGKREKPKLTRFVVNMVSVVWCCYLTDKVWYNLNWHVFSWVYNYVYPL